MTRHRSKIVIRKLGKPRKVSLRNGRTFYAKYKRVKISSLLNNVKIKWTYRQRGRRIGQQQRGKIRKENLFKKGFSLTKRVAKSTIRRGLTKIAVKKTLTLYKKGVEKIKNEKICMPNTMI